MNYFELFGFPVSFDIKQADLKKKFLELSRKYHPDFFTLADTGKQAEVLQMSALINKAYVVLSHKDSILQYLLELKGLIEPAEKFQLSPSFLSDVMEINEQLMDLEMDPNESALIKVEETTRELLKNKYHDVELTLAGYQEGITPEKALLPVKDYYFHKKYLQRILDKIASLRNIAPRT